jgi:hypothetical protein
MTKIYINLYEIDNLNVSERLTPFASIQSKEKTLHAYTNCALSTRVTGSYLPIYDCGLVVPACSLHSEASILATARIQALIWVTAWGQGGKFRFWRVPVNIGIYAEAQHRFSTIEPSLLLYFYSLVFPQFGVQFFYVSSQTFKTILKRFKI